ncbi:MAG: tRNA (guanosine(37)-N1)-methyltransferase TrmD [Lachnospiraceae bacterium]|nr:tRNA (guanosine(37)-N1)-methyltransferase TrmD [Lachnospiraceae bacterium]
MNFHVLTLFPDMVRQGLSVSVTGRAFEKGVISLNTVNIRDYTLSRHRKVDDYPYGGGAGMLMQAQPVYDAFRAVADDINAMGRDGEKARVIFVTPQGQSFHQAMAKELAKEKDLIFLCGHYEGIDERVLEEIVTDYVSIGDYVLTGGELPAMVMIDAISRMVPGVLNNGESAEIESFGNYLLEYPQYSRPEVWRDKRVPEILLSGNHEKVEEWRLNQSLERTRRLRPELYEKWAAENQAYFIKKAKREERARRKALKNQRKNAAENG